MAIFLLVAFPLIFLTLRLDVCKSSKDAPMLLWWTPITYTNERIKKCSLGDCLIKENQGEISDAKALLFYGSDVSVEILPFPRNYSQIWAALHEESPKNQPLFNHEDFITFFNITSTFRQTSNMPLTLQYLEDIRELKSLEYFVPNEVKNEFLKVLAPISYIQSDCDSPSERDSFVNELSRYINIDSFGKCLNNKNLPSGLEDISTMDDSQLYHLLSKYKFNLALENAACEDYITEKLWRPLVIGSVPIYWGSPTVSKWLPNVQSIVHVREFSSPQSLAQYLHSLLKDDAKYSEFLTHKIRQEISNVRLKEQFMDRNWGLGEDGIDKGNFFEAFECFVCDRVLRQEISLPSRPLIARIDHYGCPPPETILSGAPNPKSFWLEQWYKSKIEAKVLKELALKFKPFSIDYFYELVISSLSHSGHFNQFPPPYHDDL